MDYKKLTNKPIDGIEKVVVVDENNNEVLRGYYAFVPKRQLSVFEEPGKQDVLGPNDFEHLVIWAEAADWNMPRKLKISSVTPPHKIILAKDFDNSVQKFLLM